MPKKKIKFQGEQHFCRLRRCAQIEGDFDRALTAPKYISLSDRLGPYISALGIPRPSLEGSLPHLLCSPQTSNPAASQQMPRLLHHREAGCQAGKLTFPLYIQRLIRPQHLGPSSGEGVPLLLVGLPSTHPCLLGTRSCPSALS